MTTETPIAPEATPRATDPGLADETFGGDSTEPATHPSGRAGEWLAQLQSMIENLATQAGPVIRDIGVKAAELAAVAGEKAGPAAQRAAEFTGQAGLKLAERSRDLAAELRRDAPKASPTDEPIEAAPAEETVPTA